MRKKMWNVVRSSMPVWYWKHTFPSSSLFPCICLHLALSLPPLVAFTQHFLLLCIKIKKEKCFLRGFFFPLLLAVILLLFLLWIQRPGKFFKGRFGDFARDPQESDARELVQKPCLEQEKFLPVHLRLFKETTYFASAVCSWPFSFL